jgi:chorismate dehydratase
MTAETIIGVIAYLNVVPFFAGEIFRNFRQVSADPRTLGRQLQAGQISAAPVPVVDLWRFAEDIEPLGAFGIAAKHRACSVLLFSRFALSDIGDRPISVTCDSSTSVRLLWILLRERWGVEQPRLKRINGNEQADIVLHIGDAALQRRAEMEQAGYTTYDLAEEWLQVTGRPFVFAHWAVHRSVDNEVRQQLCDCLDAALAENLPRLPELFQPDFAPIVPDAAGLAEYLSHFSYRFGEPEYQGMELFQEKCQHYGLLTADI